MKVHSGMVNQAVVTFFQIKVETKVISSSIKISSRKTEPNSLEIIEANTKQNGNYFFILLFHALTQSNSKSTCECTHAQQCNLDYPDALGHNANVGMLDERNSLDN